MVDVEADGPIPGDYSMICFGAIVVELTAEPLAPAAEGYLQIPTTPGLGIEIDRDKLSRFAGEQKLFR